MLQLKLALRTLVHYRLYSVINLLGLALSLTCVVIIARYVHSELTVDGFNTKLDRIFITTAEQSVNPGKVMLFGISADGDNLSRHPGVERYSSFISLGFEELRIDDKVYNAKLMAVDTAFLQILDYPVTTGATNIRRPEDAFITETFAAKLFGKENPIGKTLYYFAVDKVVTVAGIIRAPANKSVLSFDVLLSSQLKKRWPRAPSDLILLSSGVDFRTVNSQYDKFGQTAGFGEARYQLFPYRDLYFDKSIVDYFGFAHGNITYVFILLSIGIMLLFVGLINYVNIHSVVMTRRNRELGMKKVFGAGSGRIFIQLIVENLLLLAGSLILAFWFAGMLHPVVENTFGIKQYPNLQFDVTLLLSLIIVIPVLVSIAPVIRYRYFSPLRSLQSINAGHKSLLVRKFFICFQYVMTTGLIVVSLFFAKQLKFMLDKDLGFRTENIISVPFVKNTHTSKEREAIASELTQKLNASPLLEHWSFGDFFLDPQGSFEFKVPGGEFQKTIIKSVDETWFKLFDVELLEGRLWDNEIDAIGYDLIVTESTLKHFGITDYRTAELQPFRRYWFSSGRDEEMKTNPPYRIVGVVKDMYTEHLSKPLSPTVFCFGEAYESFPVIVSFAPGNRQNVIELMKKLHDELIGGEFSYTSIEDKVAAIYNDDKKVATICIAFTCIAILISMLGLFGVSLFDIRQRRKEIAIRKVNGAMTVDIIRLLLKKYFVLLGMAFVIAVPVAAFVIFKYLENFAHKTTVSWWLFAVALVVTVFVSMATLLYQTNSASNENPAKVIKEGL